MAVVKFDTVESVTLTAWSADDGTLTDFTSGMSDNDLGTTVFTVGSGSDDAVRAQRDEGLSDLAVGDTILLEQTTIGHGGSSFGSWALLAYTDSNSVTETDKIVVADAVGQNVFTLTSAFIGQLGDLGSGAWAIRLVEDGGISGTAGVSEIDVKIAAIVGGPGLFLGMHW